MVCHALRNDSRHAIRRSWSTVVDLWRSPPKGAADFPRGQEAGRRNLVRGTGGMVTRFDAFNSCFSSRGRYAARPVIATLSLECRGRWRSHADRSNNVIS